MSRILLFLLLLAQYQWSAAQNDTIWYRDYLTGGLTEYALLTESKDSSDGEISHFFKGSEQLAESFFKRNNRRYGTYRSYYPDGTLREFTVYSNDLINGEYHWYDQKGTLIAKGNYKMGQRWGYWALLKEGCYGRYKKNRRHRKWKCFDSNGLMVSRTFYKYGEIIIKNKKSEGEEEKSEDHPNKTEDPQIEANKIGNPRFRENIYIGQKVTIVTHLGTKKEARIKGIVKEIKTKSSFHGIGIKVLLENGKIGRVVEFQSKIAPVD